MRILIALTYYRPHYSGLTIYVERLARALAAAGHQVTVLTSRFSPELPPSEIVDGVQIIRLEVGVRISKGVIMPSMPLHAWRLIRQADIVNVHLPQLDAALIAMQARLLGKPVVMTYHCDLHLPSGFVHQLANLASSVANQITGSLADRIVTNTQDYAENSPYLRRYLYKMSFIPPAVELPEMTAADLAAFQQKYHLEAGQPVIGMLARLATEKGVEYLVQALPHVLERFPHARVLYAGQYQNVLGEEAYAAKLKPLIEALGDHWTFLGVIPDDELVAFLHACTVTVLPSLNSTESFGMVQVESMTCGTPVVASDLPGVRQPVRMTGMGKIVAPADSTGLAEAIIQVLSAPESYDQDRMAIRKQFSPQYMAASYENVFRQLLPESTEEVLTDLAAEKASDGHNKQSES
jgi:glycosyltransferase involved in cell wall biosynthesis